MLSEQICFSVSLFIAMSLNSRRKMEGRGTSGEKDQKLCSPTTGVSQTNRMCRQAEAYFSFLPFLPPLSPVCHSHYHLPPGFLNLTNPIWQLKYWTGKFQHFVIIIISPYSPQSSMGPHFSTCPPKKHAPDMQTKSLSTCNMNNLNYSV